MLTGLSGPEICLSGPGTGGGRGVCLLSHRIVYDCTGYSLWSCLHTTMGGIELHVIRRPGVHVRTSEKGNCNRSVMLSFYICSLGLTLNVTGYEESRYDKGVFKLRIEWLCDPSYCSATSSRRLECRRCDQSLPETGT
jgi:hypothetical protein